MEGKVRPLDSCPASRRERDSKGQMGSGHRSFSVEPMGSNEETGGRPEIRQGVDSYPFFHDSQPEGWIPFGTYTRNSDLVLGDVRIPSIQSENNLYPGCFNCGSISHHVGACPLPRDRSRISLSRQYYQFFKDDSSSRHERLVDSFEWLKQRLEWVEEFEPGIIKNQLLRVALGDEDTHLKKMAMWGYPKGWFSVRDPRSVMKEHILNHRGLADPHDEDPFFIIGDKVELLPSRTSAPDKGMEKTMDCLSEPRRWARYPPAYFNTDTLPVYTPNFKHTETQAPSRTNQDDHTSTFTPDRQQLWEMIVSGRTPLENDGLRSLIPPWRRPSAFLEHSNSSSPQIETIIYDAPPLPAQSPPPLPPAPPQPSPELHPVPVDELLLAIQPQPKLPSVSPHGLLFWDSPDVCPFYLETSSSRTDITEPSYYSFASGSEEQDMEISDDE